MTIRRSIPSICDSAESSASTAVGREILKRNSSGTPSLKKPLHLFDPSILTHRGSTHRRPAESGNCYTHHRLVSPICPEIFLVLFFRSWWLPLRYVSMKMCSSNLLGLTHNYIFSHLSFMAELGYGRACLSQCGPHSACY